MQRRLVLMIILAIAFFGIASFFSLLNYYDPYSNVPLALILLLSSFFLGFVGLGTILYYFFKKIYFRGDVGMYHIYTSMRQAFFSVAYIAGIFFFIRLGIPLLFPVIVLFFMILFLELFIQTVY